MATVVTAFYPLSKSKHGVDKYRVWLRNFCAIPCPMVIFTDADSASLIRKVRADSPTVIHERPFDSWAMTSPTMMEMWRAQIGRDPERSIHSPELYAVWAIKQEAVMATIATNPFQSRWFIWCDIGIQRISETQSWYMSFPDPATCERLIPPERMLFLEVQPIPAPLVKIWKEESGSHEYTGPVPAVTLGGGCIAGDAAAWTDFSQAYIEELRRFNDSGRFNGKDQTVFFMMLMNHRTKHPFRLIHARPFTNDGDHWMCLPVILGGKAPARIDNRFEPTTA
jgi:hypothetical protein